MFHIICYVWFILLTFIFAFSNHILPPPAFGFLFAQVLARIWLFVIFALSFLFFFLFLWNAGQRRCCHRQRRCLSNWCLCFWHVLQNMWVSVMVCMQSMHKYVCIRLTLSSVINVNPMQLNHSSILSLKLFLASARLSLAQADIKAICIIIVIVGAINIYFSPHYIQTLIRWYPCVYVCICLSFVLLSGQIPQCFSHLKQIVCHL